MARATSRASIGGMIDLALGAIAAQLNQALRRGFGLREDLVVLSNLHEQDGSVALQVDNRIVVSLVNIERDTLPQRDAPGARPGQRGVVAPGPVYLNLHVLFAAHFAAANYAEALKMIAATIGHFQARPVLDHQNMPELDPRIDRLALDIANLGIAELSQLWSILSGKYLPSVLYRVRMVAVDLGAVAGQYRPVVEPRVAAL
jgi:Pvc16 N-terminal domain